jgi:hypothetical protein
MSSNYITWCTPRSMCTALTYLAGAPHCRRGSTLEYVVEEWEDALAGMPHLATVQEAQVAQVACSTQSVDSTAIGHMPHNMPMAVHVWVIITAVRSSAGVAQPKLL